ncbi:NAD-binding protein [Salinigranum marinum]|uniref:NAD-binding protein n=1 Tax=Salinigranum marinum TaxID=1515595 RepID=UPI002989F666|nr:NAD-binding protein [Salinigranum marinum]
MPSKRSTRDERLDRTEAADHYVLGGGRVGVAAARRLRAAGHDVGVVNELHCPAELPGRRGDPTDVGVLDDAGLSNAETVVVATRSDARNLLVAGLVRTRFDVPRVVVLTNAPDRVAAVAEAGHDPVCATAALSDALVDSV